MNLYWIIWLAALIGTFAIGETFAFRHPSQQNTLSRFVWSADQKFRLIAVFYGMVFGGLAVHFFWNWCPDVMGPGHGG